MATDHDQLMAERRTDRGNGPTRRLRRAGFVPGVLYQKGEESIPVAFGGRELRKVIHSSGYTGVIDLEIDGETSRPAVLRDIQVEPTRDAVLHVDFQQVDLTVEIEVSVPLRLIETPIGVREEGGVLDQPVFEVQVRALPDSIPEAIEHDVSELNIGATLTLADLPAATGVEILGEPDTPLASVILPTAEEPEPAEGELLEGELGEGAEGEEGYAAGEGGESGEGESEE
jgi:large subunit ribosomal protein L25